MEHFDEACRRAPKNPDYPRSLAKCLAAALKTTGAVETYGDLLAMLRARKDHVAVLEVALRILDIAPGQPAAMDALRDAHRAIGARIEESAQALEQPA